MRRVAAENSTEARTSLGELAWLFLKLGSTAFGGPAAHTAMMQVEVVQRRRWLEGERFLDLVSAANLIPGPNSTELAIHIGWERRRWAGLVVAGAAFIAPAAILAGVLGWAYVRFGAVPAVGWLLYGVKPAMLGVVVQAIVALASKAARTTPQRALALISVLAAAFGAHELLVLLGAGLVAMVASRPWRAPAERRRKEDAEQGGASRSFAPWLAMSATVAAPSALTLPSLFGVFAKIGSVLFGSGYVLLAFLRADLVERLRWLTEAQLMDAVTVGQVTPGPVFTTATFIGYLLQGPWGAVVATAGIFLPAFVFVAASGPLVPRLRRSAWAGAFLDGVNVASLALMAVVTFALGRASLVDVPTVVLGLASAAVLLRFKPNPTWLVVGCGALGAALHAAGVAGWPVSW